MWLTFCGLLRAREMAPHPNVFLRPDSLNTLDFYHGALGVCPSHPLLQGKGAAGRCTAAGSKKPETYSQEYIEDSRGYAQRWD